MRAVWLPLLNGMYGESPKELGWQSTFQVSPDFGRVSKEIELVVFRTVQECLTNIHRHSRSESATIQLFRDDPLLTLDVHDGGKGICAEELAQIHAGGSGVDIRGNVRTSSAFFWKHDD